MKKLFIFLILMLSLSDISFATWLKGSPVDAELIPDAPGIIRANNSALDTGLASNCDIGIVYTSATTVTASPGSCTINNSDGSVRVFINNSSSTAVTFADIDTGAEAGSTTYYVYAVAASTASTTATFVVSTNSSAPSGETYYTKVGSFYNNSSSNIDATKVYSAPYDSVISDSSGKDLGKLVAIYDYGTSASSSTRRDESTVYIAYGRVTLSSGTATISNLPFTDTPSCVGIKYVAGDVSQAVQINAISSSSVTFRDSLSGNPVIPWICIGE